ncbi:MAG: glutamate--tRNA ligase [Candidatus Woesearchaeota archaeon]
MKSIIFKLVLKNAYDFNGKVNSKVVLGLVLKDDEGLKKKVPEVLKEIELAVKEVEKLTSGEIKKQLQKVAPEMLKEQKKEQAKGPLKELPEAKQGKVCLRIAPSPSGPLHIGHAYGASLNYEYAKMYNGKFIVRIEDTNPENIYEPAYSLIEDDARWITENYVSEIVVQSSRLGSYYDHAEKLVELGKAYVCTCNSDKWRDLKNEGTACPCRTLSLEENRKRYARMFNEYAEGEAVLRLKTDIQDKNPAMRDFPIMRINEHIHPKTGKEQRVWPLMVLSVAIDDHELGITHVLNGKDHADNAKKEALIMKYLGWDAPVYKHWGRINFEGFKLSTSQTRIAIEQNEYTGWDDIRLATLLALRRRGYQAGAFRRYAVEIGLSLNDKTVSKEEFWKNINSFNRELIEPNSNRYFFIDNPVQITVDEVLSKEAKIKLHPDFPERGERKFKLGKEFLVSKTDFKLLEEGKLHRLMDAFNFEIRKGKFICVSADYEEFRKAKNKGLIIHWLPAEEKLKVEVLQEDNSFMVGVGEAGMSKLKVGEIIQMERRYFARLDKKEKDRLIFYYLHR